MKHKILFVDDEKSILSAIKRVFFKEDYDLFFAGSGREGLELIKNTQFSVIVSDVRMPEMDGFHFLTEANSALPDAIRIILSGYADIESVMKAINEDHVWKYISKPWNENDLILSIRNAITVYEEAAEKKQLLLELEKKNKLLSHMNETLEKKVKARTWQIEKRSELLQMIIEGSDLVFIQKKAIENISKITGITNLLFKSIFSDEIITLSQITIPDKVYDCLSLSETRIKSVKNDGIYVFVLISENEYMGSISVFGTTEEELAKFREAVNFFKSIILLALFQKKSIETTPDLINRLDLMLGNLN